MKKPIQLSAFFALTICSVTFGQADAQPEADSNAGNPDEAIEIPVERNPWTGRIDFGYTWQSGRADKSELSVRGQADRTVDIHEFRAITEFLYGELEGVRNTQRLTGSFRWRADLSERTFTQALTLYENDRIREIRNRVEQNVGIGYRFIKTEGMDASIVPGFTVQYTDETGVDDRWSYLASVFQDFRWTISPAYRFEQDLNFLIDPGDTDDHIVRFNAGIVGTVSDSINLSIRYQYLFENQVRPGVEKTDQRVIAAVGYSF